MDDKNRKKEDLLRYVDTLIDYEKHGTVIYWNLLSTALGFISGALFMYMYMGFTVWTLFMFFCFLLLVIFVYKVLRNHVLKLKDLSKEKIRILKDPEITEEKYEEYKNKIDKFADKIIERETQKKSVIQRLIKFIKNIKIMRRKTNRQA